MTRHLSLDRPLFSHVLHGAALLFATTAAMACEAPDERGDAGALDAGALDAGALDAGALDAGALDAGDRDAGPPDGGTPDAAIADAAAGDAGPADAPFTVHYRFSLPEHENCEDAGASLVDVYLASSTGEITSLENQPCQDEALVVLDVEPGTYDVEIVAWDLELWSGAVTGVSHSIAAPAETTVDLEIIGRR